MSGQRAHEGYLLIDNRNAPGPGTLVLSGGREVVSPGGATVVEMATYTCSHCSAQVVRNPARERERAWCWKCDHVICDPCSLLSQSRPHVPMAQRLEQAQTRAIRDLRGR